MRSFATVGAVLEVIRVCPAATDLVIPADVALTTDTTAATAITATAMIHPANFKGLGVDGFDKTILLFGMPQRCNFGTLLRINRLGLRAK
jgi:hypothetical protein